MLRWPCAKRRCAFCGAETDGWFSADSAEIYESSTETLFLGRQDAMQRSTLVPLARHLQSAGVQSGAGLKLLEVACGTGRFATYIKVCTLIGHAWCVSSTTTHGWTSCLTVTTWFTGQLARDGDYMPGPLAFLLGEGPREHALLVRTYPVMATAAMRKSWPSSHELLLCETRVRDAVLNAGNHCVHRGWRASAPSTCRQLLKPYLQPTAATMQCVSLRQTANAGLSVR